MINLLPQKSKQNIRFEKINRQVIFVGELAFMVTVLLAGLLLGELAFTFITLREVNRRVADLSLRPEVKQVAQFQQQLRIFKADVERARRIQEQHPDLFGAVQEVASHLPRAVRMTSLDLDMRERHAVLSGFSPTRADLLALKEALQANSRYTEVNFPLAHLLKETNIDFTISFSFKPSL